MNEKQPFGKRIRKDLDELRLQSKLGKAEAIDYFEEKKDELGDFVEETKGQLNEWAGPARKETAKIRQSLDELQLQLNLGRMETVDAYHEQKEKIEDAIRSSWRHLCEIEDAGEEAMSKTRASFAHRAGAFGAKLELLSLNLGAAKINRNEELRLKHDQVRKDLEEWSGRLEEATGIAGEEAREAWKSLKRKIRESIK